MTNKTTEALKLAEEALETAPIEYDFHGEPVDKEFAVLSNKALAAIREALSEQEKQEPVAKVTDVFPTRVEWLREVAVNSLLYASPVDAKAIRAEALEEAEEIAKTIGGSFSVEFLAAIRGGLK